MRTSDTDLFFGALKMCTSVSDLFFFGALHLRTSANDLFFGAENAFRLFVIFGALQMRTSGTDLFFGVLKMPVADLLFLSR